MNLSLNLLAVVAGATLTLIVMMSGVIWWQSIKIERAADLATRVELTHARAIAEHEALYRAQERKWGEATARLTESLRREQEALQDELETVIADRDAGALRLRDDLRGCRAQLSGDTPTPSGDHGAGKGGLSPARQSLALRIGAECDAVVHKLTAAQEYIRAIQGR